MTITDEALRDLLGRRIEAIRRTQGKTQQEIADAAGMHIVNYNKIVKGKTVPGARALFAIADALGVSTDTLRSID